MGCLSSLRKVETELFPYLRKYGMSFYKFNPCEIKSIIYLLPVTYGRS